MWSKVAHFIEENQLLHQDALQLVAVSGGADSVALLLVLKQLNFKVEAVHCNFHLRGEESQRDENFVANLCKRHEIALHKVHFDTKTYAELHKVSIEMAARNLRYAYFEQLRNELSAEKICVGHHKEDVAETVLINLIRGTGLRGLTGIAPKNGYVARPLLAVSRDEIELFLKEKGETFVTDSTNNQPFCTRNKVRLQLLPLLKTINPSVIDTLCGTANRLAEVEKVYTHATSQAISKLFDGKKLSLEQLAAQPSQESILHELLHPLGFNGPTILDILGTQEQPRIFLSPTHQALVHRGTLYIEQRQPKLPPLIIPECGTYILADGRKINIAISEDKTVSRTAHIATLDAEKVDFPLTLRPIAAGDRFTPFGMKGTQLVSDYLTNHKINLFERQRTLVLTQSDGQIIWLVGHRTSQNFAVGPQTKKVITIKM